MSKPLIEALLARVTDSTRAAAILGDLEELAATRGRLWFWTAYARTIISLGWRTPAAFLFGYFAFELMMWLVPMWIRHTPPVWSSTSLNFARMDPLVDAVTVPLWFALPYGLLRYGWRDRFVRVSCVVFGVATVLFVYPPAPSVIAAIVIALAGATLVSPVWRRPAFVLVSTVAASAVVVAVVFNGVPLVSSYLLEQLPNPHLEYRLQIPWRAIDLAALFVPAIVCARLHGLLLTTPSANRDLT